MTHHLNTLSICHIKNRLVKQYKSINTKSSDNKYILNENKYFSELHGEL